MQPKPIAMGNAGRRRVFLLGAFLLTGGAVAEAQKFTAPAAPPAGKALILVYRQSAMFAAATHWPVFVNGDFLGYLHNGNYIPVEVPVGKAFLTRENIQPRLNGGTIHWPAFPPSGSACDGMDWRHLRSARPADLSSCEDELNRTRAVLEAAAREIDPARFGILPTAQAMWSLIQTIFNTSETKRYLAAHPELKDQLRICGPVGLGLDHCYDEVRTALIVFEPPEGLRLTVEEGKTYYVKMSVTISSCKEHHDPKTMACIPNETLVDGAIGAKEISHLNLATDK